MTVGSDRFWSAVTHLYSPKVSSLFWRSKSISFFSLSFTVRRKTFFHISTLYLRRIFRQIIGSGVPAYFPPLLRLMRQRMRRMRMRSTMALMSPINQPWVAKRPGISDGTEAETFLLYRVFMNVNNIQSRKFVFVLTHLVRRSAAFPASACCCRAGSSGCTRFLAGGPSANRNPAWSWSALTPPTDHQLHTKRNNTS